MTTTEAQAIWHEMATFNDGLRQILEAVLINNRIISAVHEELCKDPPPSKIPEALAKLTEAIERVEVKLTGPPRC
jgi:hypothetical protein